MTISPSSNEVLITGLPISSGGTVFGGVEFGFGNKKMFRVGGEAGYRTVPDKLGAAGTSAIFNEKDLGGVYFRITFGVGF